MAGHSALRLDLVHAASLERRRLLARLLDFEEHCPAVTQAQQVRHASKLMRPAVDRHDPPAGFFGCPNYRCDDAGFERHSVALRLFWLANNLSASLYESSSVFAYLSSKTAQPRGVRGWAAGEPTMPRGYNSTHGLATYAAGRQPLRRRCGGTQVLLDAWLELLVSVFHDFQIPPPVRLGISLGDRHALEPP